MGHLWGVQQHISKLPGAMGFTESIPMEAIVRPRLKMGLQYVSDGHAAGIHGLIDLRRPPGLQAARESVIGRIALSQQ